MNDRKGLVLETRRAMFRAVLVARCAGEAVVTGRRLVAALLRTESASAFCSRAGIDIARLLDAIDDPTKPAFDACQQRVDAGLAEQGVVFGSKEHLSSVNALPGDPRLKTVFDGIIEARGQLAIAPLELLLELIRAEPVLAGLLARHGIDEQSLGER